MTLDKNFIPHDFGARKDDKIIRIRRKFDNGYGWYWILVEVMMENDGYIHMDLLEDVLFDNRIPEKEGVDFVNECVNIKLFLKDDQGRITSNRVQKNIARITKIREQNRENAIKGWEKRRAENDNTEEVEDQEVNAARMRAHSDRNADKIRLDKINKSNVPDLKKSETPPVTEKLDYCVEHLSRPISEFGVTDPKPVELAAKVRINGTEEQMKYVRTAVWYWARIVKRLEAEGKKISRTLSDKANAWSWAEDIRKLHSIDGNSFKDILEVIKFVLEHEPTGNSDFSWFDNVQSPSKLREKFADLYNKQKTSKHASTSEPKQKVRTVKGSDFR